MKVKPLGDRLLVERIEAEETTSGGIVLPDSAKEKSQEGKVLAVGEGKLLENGERGPMLVKEGDHIIFSSYAGTEIKMEGKEYLIMSQEDVLAVVK